MPSPDRPEGGPASQPDPTPYYQAARFRGERPAGKAYTRAQDLIFRADCELSAYRFHLDRIWHVAVVGDRPPDDLERQVRKILSRGEPASLPQTLLSELARRRAQATRLGPWVERHFRPGKTL